MPSISVSLSGDERYRDALNTVAKRHKRHAGELVREALDRCFGEEIQRAILFFDQDVEFNQRSLDRTQEHDADHG